MVARKEHIERFEAAGATVPGVSADSAFSQAAFADEYDLGFDLGSDMGGAAIEAYGLSMDIPPLGLSGVANRAVFVVDVDGTVTYAWAAADPTTEPDYEELVEAAEAA